MEIKVLKHTVRDNLVVVSKDIYDVINQEGMSRYQSGSTFDNGIEVVRDQWLAPMTIVVPDRDCFDLDISKSLDDIRLFSGIYLKTNGVEI